MFGSSKFKHHTRSALVRLMDCYPEWSRDGLLSSYEMPVMERRSRVRSCWWRKYRSKFSARTVRRRWSSHQRNGFVLECQWICVWQPRSEL